MNTIAFHSVTIPDSAGPGLIVSVGPDVATPDQFDRIQCALNDLRLELVEQWDQRATPEVGILIGQDSKTGGWREYNVELTTRRGVYFGNNLVAVREAP